MGAGMSVRRASRHPQIQPSEQGARVTRRRSRGNSPVAPESPVPQIQAMEEAAGMPPRRSASLRPHIQPSEQFAGMPPRRSPRLHPQIEASEEGAGVTCGRSRNTSTVELQSLPFNNDMLREILIRLPPLPSSLPRASAVCKRWRGLVTDAKFQRQFRAHHRKPPLLGAFVCGFGDQEIVFTPVLDPPDRIPPHRFDLGRLCASNTLVDCRHGRVLINDRVRNEVVVCDPITGEQRSVPVPPGFKFACLNGAVLCASSDLSHVQGGCHSSPFKVVLMSSCTNDKRQIACVYSSETGIWGTLISAEAPPVFPGEPAVLVGNCLYWLSIGNGMIELDLDEESLTGIRGPATTFCNMYGKRKIIRAEDGTVGFAILSYPCLEMWQRNINSQGVAMWVPWKTIEMDSILGLPPLIQGEMGGNAIIRGYDEDTDVIFLDVKGSVYMVQLKPMQSRKLHKTINPYRYHPFKSFYTAAIRECDEADMKHDP